MNRWKRILLVFKFFMVLVYLVMGAVILFTNVLPLPINNTGRIFFGVILILYGLFRIYSYYTVTKEQSDEE